MTNEAGPNIVYNGLVLHYDAANFRSYNPAENLFLYSEDFSNAYWLKSGITITPNSGAAPDGTNTANLVTTTNSGNAYFERTSAIADTSTYTYSVYIRGIGTSIGKTIVFGNYNNGVLRQNTAFILTSEWQRVSATFTPTQTSFNNLYIHTIGQGANLTTSDTFYIWGAQLEKGDAMSIYSKTITSAITRSTTWTDLSGNENNGTFSGDGPAYSSANNGILVFDGVNDMITVTTNTGFGNASLSPNQSMCFWYRHNDDNVFDFLCGFRNDLTYDFYTLIIDTGSGDVLEVRARTATGSMDTNITWQPSYNNIWKHISVTVSGSAVVVYLDGQQVNSSNTLSGIFGTSSSNFWIGRYSSNGFPAKGSMGQILFYNRAITASEVRQNYNAIKGRYGL